ncbi:MAG: hypothetical protein LBK62_11180 [Treponema sp.]|jgi:hypothetical protein|nr:hypothetical protein [Treponema sp.]
MGNSINIPEIIEKARKQPANEPNLSPTLKATVDLLINLCLLLVQKRLLTNCVEPKVRGTLRSTCAPAMIWLIVFIAKVSSLRVFQLRGWNSLYRNG